MMGDKPWYHDRRWDEIGELLVKQATAVCPGEKVMIAMGEIDSFPLLMGVYKACIRVGAFPQVQFLSEGLQQIMLEFGSKKQIEWVPYIEAKGMEWADVYIALRGAFELDIHDGISQDRLALSQKPHGVISTMRWQNTRWTLVRVPNETLARQMGGTIDELLDMFFDACLMDVDESIGRWQEYVRFLEGGRQMRIVGRNTDLRFSVEGRKWFVWAGEKNIPDGEIMTSPVHTTVDGVISFENPGVFGGRLMRDLTLRWERGRLVSATSSTNEEYLHSIIATDEGSCNVGEFGIGVNPFLTRFCNDILLDEKIAGTVHIALGRAYPECGGTNTSAIHWDIVKDLRNDGTLYLDTSPVMEKGEFTI